MVTPTQGMTSPVGGHHAGDLVAHALVANQWGLGFPDSAKLFPVNLRKPDKQLL